MSPTRTTSTIELPAVGIGSRQHIKVLEWLPAGYNDAADKFTIERAYIQASLHADELPGLLVAHHLVKMLDAAAAAGKIARPITVVPFANPLGLSQVVLGGHIGRFSLTSGVNFNREWPDVSAAVKERVKDKLVDTDPAANEAIIRQAIWEEAQKLTATRVDKHMKIELFKRACLANLVLDLHCDGAAVMHTYTHDRLWPAMADMAQCMGSQCNIVSSQSGGNPCDEAFSDPWAQLMDAFPSHCTSMGCQSATIELRGEDDVCDELALRDARGLYCLLARRGYVCDPEFERSFEFPPSSLDATPLTAVDNMEATMAGVFAWKVRPGDRVVEGQLLGEIVSVEDVDAPREPIVARTAGLVYGMSRGKLAVPGAMAAKVAGVHPLGWRKGLLLSA